MVISVIVSCEQNISKSYEQILINFFAEVGNGPGTNQLDFGSDPDSFVDCSGHELTGEFFTISRQGINEKATV